MIIINLPTVFKTLRAEYKRFKTPYVTEVAAQERKDPFKVLVSCIISLRTKDETTRQASERLFKLAVKPGTMARLSTKTIEQAIYPAGFYRRKAETIKNIADRIENASDGNVPDTIDELLKLKGVGRKTANLVVTMGFNKPGICVDTHVHRITNRWGLVETSTPDETEAVLREILPMRYWLEINDLLVAYGQNLCKPTSPMCGRCRIAVYCHKVGILHSR